MQARQTEEKPLLLNFQGYLDQRPLHPESFYECEQRAAETQFAEVQPQTPAV